MNQNDQYLQALGIPQWVPREIVEPDEKLGDVTQNKADQSETVDTEPTGDGTVEGEVIQDVKVDVLLGETATPTQSITIKALVNHPGAKFAIVVPESLERNELQLFWKQLKFAWLQWHDQDKEFPASLFQVDQNSDYLLENIQKQNLLLATTSEICQQETSLELPSFTNKKALWQLLQTISEKVELL